MSEKVARLGSGLKRVNLLSHDRENLRESKGLPDSSFFFHDHNREMTSSIT